jgi:hypothetical protein
MNRLYILSAEFESVTPVLGFALILADLIRSLLYDAAVMSRANMA